VFSCVCQGVFVCVSAGYLSNVHRPDNVIVIVHCIDLDSITEQGSLHRIKYKVLNRNRTTFGFGFFIPSQKIWTIFRQSKIQGRQLPFYLPPSSLPSRHRRRRITLMDPTCCCCIKYARRRL